MRFGLEEQLSVISKELKFGSQLRLRLRLCLGFEFELDFGLDLCFRHGHRRADKSFILSWDNALLVYNEQFLLFCVELAGLHHGVDNSANGVDNSANGVNNSANGVDNSANGVDNSANRSYHGFWRR